MRKSPAFAGSAGFLALAPGGVAGWVPYLLTGWQAAQPWRGSRQLYVPGLVLVACGALVLLHAFGRFVSEGAGTPAPVAPTERLVIGGLYRHVRNPMYLAVVAIIVGQALLLAQHVLLLYATAVWVAMALFVICYEEPTLGRRYASEYAAYRRAVPAWWPRLRPYRP